MNRIVSRVKGRPGPALDRGRANAAAGFVLQTAALLLLMVSAVVGLMFYAVHNHSNNIRRWQASDQCLLDAQSVLEQVKYELTQSYLSNQAAAAGSLQWFQVWDITSIGSNPIYHLPAFNPINGSAVTVTIASVTLASNAGYATVQLIGAAGRSAPFGVTRMIEESFRVYAASGGGDVMPFEYAYLLNSSGQLRNNMVINGDVRVNGNYRLNNASFINGSRYVSGQLTANAPYWSVADYWSRAGAQARPTDPTSSTATNLSWPMGYVPTKLKNAFLPVFLLPSIEIETLAASAQGSVSRGGVQIAANTYAGPGPDNISGTADDNCLVLDGSSAPLTIQGTVVVRGDLIIRGKVSGQGQIYAGRNVHIVGDLAYVNPPAWPKPDSNPVATAAQNASRDLLVLGAKGNIVVGNYTTATWSNRVWGILAASANSYAVSASDAALGYDSDNNPANGYVFDGRYFANEANNGRRLSGVGTNTVPRKYYESSLADAAFSALCDAQNVPSINAALLSDHGIIGNLGSSAAGGNTVLNGAMACHDELDSFYGLFTINWDIRLGSTSKELLSAGLLAAGTGGVAAASSTIGWREIH